MMTGGIMWEFLHTVYEKDVSSSVRRGEDRIICVACDEEHSFNSNEPLCLFIPPSLPSTNGR
jgi:hypothetical protein